MQYSTVHAVWEGKSMKIKPFKGIRPPKELVEKVNSRPYDVLSSEEARKEAEGNPMSLYHIIKPEINFEPMVDEHDERVYPVAAEQFKLFREKGWLKQDEEELYYVYAQEMNGKKQYGLVVAAWVEDYMEGRIKKHEFHPGHPLLHRAGAGRRGHQRLHRPGRRHRAVPHRGNSDGNGELYERLYRHGQRHHRHV